MVERKQGVVAPKLPAPLEVQATVPVGVAVPEVRVTVTVQSILPP